MQKKNLSKCIEQVFETENGQKAEWFGYYNYDPLDEGGKRLLCHQSVNDGVAVEKGMTVTCGYYDINTKYWHEIGESDSYNWQQGAMLQWLPGEGNQNKVIYNLSKNNHLISRIVDVNSGEIKDVPCPIYGLLPDGKHSIALDLERSYWCRAYHYESVANEVVNCPIPEGDGIFSVNLDTGEKTRIVSIQDVLSLDAEEDFPELQHWFEHIMVSPNGKRFVFLHRFSPVGDVFHYETRMILASIDGKNLQVIPGWKDNSWSHFGWNGDDEFAIYTVKIASAQKTLTKAIKESNEKMFSLGTIRKNVLSYLKKHIPKRLKYSLKGQRSGYQYYRYNSMNSEFELVDWLSGELLDIDGHPSFTKDGRYMITDSYPDLKGFRRLVALDLQTKKRVLLAKMYAGLNHTPARCDLHPKLSRDNQYVTIDTAYTGKHRMIVLRLKWDEIKKVLS